MRVMGSRLLIRKLPVEQLSLSRNPSKSNILLVNLGDPRPSIFGEVIALGTDKSKKIDPDLAVGDRIVLKQICGTPVEINKETLYFIEPEDVYCVIRE